SGLNSQWPNSSPRGGLRDRSDLPLPATSHKVTKFLLQTPRRVPSRLKKAEPTISPSESKALIGVPEGTSQICALLPERIASRLPSSVNAAPVKLEITSRRASSPPFSAFQTWITRSHAFEPGFELVTTNCPLWLNAAF